MEIPKTLTRAAHGGVMTLAVLLAIPGQASAQQAAYQTLCSFDYDPNGAFPAGGVVEDAAGKFYGTTTGGGGGSEDGVVFELARGAGDTWTETVLYRFSSGPDGSTPDAGLTLDPSSGKLYGTAQYASGMLTGVVFELAPPANQGGAWKYSVIYAFSGGADGGDPEGELLLSPNGSLFGTTATGGSGGGGVVFRLKPPIAPGGGWTYSLLHSFNPATESQDPFGPLAADDKGDIYGVTEGGGQPGIVFEISPAGGGDSWNFLIIHRFSGPDGAQSYTGVVRRKSDGALFGGTDFGGDNNLGVVFQLTPPAAPEGEWADQTVYSFSGGTDGCNPAALAVGPNGELYGATTPLDCPTGNVFRLDPPAPQAATWTFVTLVQDSNVQQGPLMLNKTGLYGTDYFGGVTGQGSVFRVSER